MNYFAIMFVKIGKVWSIIVLIITMEVFIAVILIHSFLFGLNLSLTSLDIGFALQNHSEEF